MKNSQINPQLSKAAKAIVALAFRNGPIENVHAGKMCPLCNGKPEYSGITDAEMKEIMKDAVDQLYGLLWLKQISPRSMKRGSNSANSIRHAGMNRYGRDLLQT